MEKNNESITPRDLIKKHIENKDHVVTAEEFDKLKVGEQAEDEAAIQKEAELKKEEIEHPHIPNPYDVL